MKTTPQNCIEPLEARIAPAAVYAYTDVDGDKVKITSSVGTDTDLKNAAEPHLVGGQLQTLDLSGSLFNGASITVTVARAGGGDGVTAVGHITGGTNNFKQITIKGDLGDIDGGSNAAGTPAIASLSVRSLGRFGLATQGGAGDLESDIVGALGALNVTGDVKEAFINVTGSSGAIGPVTIGGSFIGGGNAMPGIEDHSGEIFSSGVIGAVKIGGDVQGGGGFYSGYIHSNGMLASVTIGGSVIGAGVFSPGIENHSGEIFSSSGLGAVKIGHDVQGGGGFYSAYIHTDGKLAGLTIGGSVIGATLPFPGPIHSGEIYSKSDLGAVKIGHNVQGGAGFYFGYIHTNGKLASVTLGGSVIGSGAISSKGGTGAVKIGHDVQGSISSSGQLASVAIGGSLTGGVFSSGNLGAVKIGHDVPGGSISSNGMLASVTIGGSLLGGSSNNTGTIYSKGDLGAVKIGGDFRGGSLSFDFPLESSGLIESRGRIASVTIGGSIFAGTDDSQMGILANNAAIRAGLDLGSLTVKGSLIGAVGRLGHITNVTISAVGQPTPTATTDLAMGKISIGGRVERAQILAGYLKQSFPQGSSLPVNGNAQIGAVSVGGDWIASDLIAGVQDGGTAGFGDAADTIIGGGGSIAKIASILIKGLVQGTTAGGDQFGFESHTIGSFKINGLAVPLPAALSLLTGSDVTVRLV